jgi:hypothetical protein
MFVAAPDVDAGISLFLSMVATPDVDVGISSILVVVSSTGAASSSFGGMFKYMSA